MIMSSTRRVARASLPTRYGAFEMFVYEAPEHEEHVGLTLGVIDDGGAVPVRVHSECLTGDVFGSSRCDCGEQLARNPSNLGYLRTKREKMGHLLPMAGPLEVACEGSTW